MQVRTAVGWIELRVWYGLDPEEGSWGCPMRQRWGLGPHQEMSPWLEDKLAFTVTATNAYGEAAAVAQKWGCGVDDSTVYDLTQRLGQRAEQQTQLRLETTPPELTLPRESAQLAIFMLDGWQARYRGAGWGKKKTQKKRVEWHEFKTGVFYWHDQSGQTDGGRGVINEKVVIGWQEEGGAELGRRLHWEALRRGLGRAKWILVLGDGAHWIWNVAADRWAKAEELLDFYHASEHVWELGRALHGENRAQEWVEARLHELRHGREQECLDQIATLKVPAGEAGEVIEEQKNYFANNTERMNYKELSKRGWPIGSGAVESACAGKQGRFKRRGQFWTHKGIGHLEALIEARQNKHWDEIWFAA
jgi:hypothetical protein